MRIIAPPISRKRKRIRKTDLAGDSEKLARGGARRPLAYVLLWFPLASETFVFREIESLRQQGLNIRAYTMYGPARKGLSRAMADYSGPVVRMGSRNFFRILAALARRTARQPALVWRLMRGGLFRRMRSIEAHGENLWCFLAGFLLAEQCEKDGVGLIHSAWANGPATAAWVASSLTGIPFAFSGRAGDIYPEDGILADKAAAARFIRTNNAANVAWLSRFCPQDQKDKIRLVYNGLTFAPLAPKKRPAPAPPYRLLAVGRFVRTKGFPDLLTAVARLKRERFPVKLTLIGDGVWKRRLLALRRRLKLEDCVDMPGFVPNDRLEAYMSASDLLVAPSVVHANGDRDGIPNVIMEACSVGLPVVATDVCGISEVVRNGETGRLAPERRPDLLAETIRAALENPEKTTRMSEAARELVTNMFDPEKNGAALRDIYLEILDRDGNSASAACC